MMARFNRDWLHPATRERVKFEQNMNDHFLEGKPLKYKFCYANSYWNVEQRKKQAKIIKYLIEHPFATFREVGRIFNRDHHRVANLLRRYPKIKMKIQESREQEILNMYEDVLYDIAEITHKNVWKYKESDEKLRTTELKDLSAIAKETQERKNLMEGRPTEHQAINITIN